VCEVSDAVGAAPVVQDLSPREHTTSKRAPRKARPRVQHRVSKDAALQKGIAKAKKKPLVHAKQAKVKVSKKKAVAIPVDPATAAARRRAAVKYPVVHNALLDTDEVMLSAIAAPARFEFGFLANVPGGSLPRVTQSVAVLCSEHGTVQHPVSAPEHCMLYLAGSEQ
jgi:type II secretory pathway component HofQ